MNKNLFNFIVIIIASSVFAVDPNYYNDEDQESSTGPSGAYRGVGQYGYPGDPMSDRAKGYLLKGKVKSAVTNYGSIINWDYDPAGLWGEYAYLPALAIIAGAPGHQYSSYYQDWVVSDMPTYYPEWDAIHGGELVVWCSEDLYDEWNLDPELLTSQDLEAQDVGASHTVRPNGKYIGIVFETEDDRGIVGERKLDIESFDGINQWAFDDYNAENGGSSSRVCFAISSSDLSISVDPNLSNAMIGVMYPWALRPALKERRDEFDLYEYGLDGDDWSEDDEYVYYGATTQESWFTSTGSKSDWHATTKAKENTHGTDVNAGDLFGGTIFTDDGDSYPLLAHSSYSQSWPQRFKL